MHDNNSCFLLIGMDNKHSNAMILEYVELLNEEKMLRADEGS